MIIRITIVAAAIAVTLLTTTTGCAVTRGQETTGAYIDDSDHHRHGEESLRREQGRRCRVDQRRDDEGHGHAVGLCEECREKSSAETIARGVSGVTSVKNEIAVRP